MLSTAQDFQTAIAFMQDENAAFNTQFNNNMDAAVFNSTFNEIEDDINNLYEKVRVLEDIKNYTKEFVLKAIEERRIAIEENLKVIESATDDYQNTEFITTKVGLNNIVRGLTDRDGSPIKSLDFRDNSLNMPSIILDSEQVLTISNLGQVKAIQEYDDLFAEAEPFEEQRIFNDNGRVTTCSIYESDQPVEGGINVKYEIFFEHMTECNFLWLDTINCNVKRISITDEDGLIHYLGVTDTYLSPSRKIAKIMVIVNCSHYESNRISCMRTDQVDAFDIALKGSDIDGN